jgi:hypothetical protein
MGKKSGDQKAQSVQEIWNYLMCCSGVCVTGRSGQKENELFGKNQIPNKNLSEKELFHADKLQDDNLQKKMDAVVLEPDVFSSRNMLKENASMGDQNERIVLDSAPVADVSVASIMPTEQDAQDGKTSQSGHRKKLKEKKKKKKEKLKEEQAKDGKTSQGKNQKENIVRGAPAIAKEQSDNDSAMTPNRYLFM